MKKDTTPPPPSIRTFALDLGDGTRCTARLDLAQVALVPANKLPGILDIEWTGGSQLRVRHWPLYFAWTKSVWQQVADTAQKAIVLAFAPPHLAPFAVVFEPHLPCEMVSLPCR